MEKRLLATLWLLANKESFRSVADRFGMSKGNLHYVMISTAHALTDKRRQVFKWPHVTEMQRTAEAWQSSKNFPGIIGAIDGSYIPIPGPGEDRDAYICRKGFPAMHLQVCESVIYNRNAYLIYS